MIYLLSLLLLSFIISPLQAQQLNRLEVQFSDGQNVINLQQLEAVKSLANRAKSIPNAKIIIRGYADDAQGGDDNLLLSSRRITLLKQCLEREAIPVSNMRLENYVSSQEGNCTRCAELLITTNDLMFNRKQAEDQLRMALQKGFQAQVKNYTVDNSKQVIITLDNGDMLVFDALAFGVNKVEIHVQNIDKTANRLALCASSLQRENSLQNWQKLYRVQAFTPDGTPVNLAPSKGYSLIYAQDKEQLEHQASIYRHYYWLPFNKEAQSWQGAFMQGELNHYCKNGKDARPQDPLLDKAPAPFVPYNPIDELRDQDQEILRIETSIAQIQVQLANKKTKKNKELSQQLQQRQKQQERALVTAKNKKQEIREEANALNKKREAQYYQKVARYNQRRNGEQQAFIQALNQWSNSKKSFDDYCTEERQRNASLQTAYTSINLEQILQALQEQQNGLYGQWWRFEELGYIGSTQALAPIDYPTDFFINMGQGAYSSIAFLILDESKRIVQGRAISDKKFQFPSVPEGELAQLIVLHQKEDAISTSWNSVVIDKKNFPIQVQKSSWEHFYKKMQELNN